MVTQLLEDISRIQLYDELQPFCNSWVRIVGNEALLSVATPGML